MIIRVIVTYILAACTLIGYAQSDDAIHREQELNKSISFLNQKQAESEREVVGVAQFKCQQNSPYTYLVTEKIVEILKNTNRFIVVDRTNMDKVNAEMEYQKREEFIGKDVVEQGNNIAAKKMIIGTITKLMVYRIKNTDGNIRGYKAGIAFELQMQDVETRDITHATSFEGKQSKECVSAEAAVQMCMNSMEDEIANYFYSTFPLKAKIVKISVAKDGVAQKIFINVGNKHGVKVGDHFTIEAIESIDNEEFPVSMGKATITKLNGESFSECIVEKKYGREILNNFNAGGKMRCTLITKKK